MATQLIELLDGRRVQAIYVRHVRTLTRQFLSSTDVDLFRLEDGTLVECQSPENDGRAVPVECDPALDGYAGHSRGA